MGSVANVRGVTRWLTSLEGKVPVVIDPVLRRNSRQRHPAAPRKGGSGGDAPNVEARHRDHAECARSGGASRSPGADPGRRRASGARLRRPRGPRGARQRWAPAGGRARRNDRRAGGRRSAAPFRARRAKITPHGTGCTLASLIAGKLAGARRIDDEVIVSSVRWAKHELCVAAPLPRSHRRGSTGDSMTRAHRPASRERLVALGLGLAAVLGAVPRGTIAAEHAPPGAGPTPATSTSLATSASARAAPPPSAAASARATPPAATASARAGAAPPVATSAAWYGRQHHAWLEPRPDRGAHRGRHRRKREAGGRARCALAIGRAGAAGRGACRQVGDAARRQARERQSPNQSRSRSPRRKLPRGARAGSSTCKRRLPADSCASRPTSTARRATSGSAPSSPYPRRRRTPMPPAESTARCARTSRRCRSSARASIARPSKKRSSWRSRAAMSTTMARRRSSP